MKTLLLIVALSTASMPVSADKYLYPTIPGTDVRDYTASGWIIETDQGRYDGKQYMYPTIPGTEVRDYTKPGFVIDEPGSRPRVIYNSD